METEKVEQFMKLKTKVVFGDSFILNLAETENGFCFVIYIWDKSTSYFTYNEDEDEACQSCNE